MPDVMPGRRGASALLVTTSWDDGHPSDLRLADLLAKHGITGTFYVPNRNVEGRKVMQPHKVRQLGTRFEVGGHTRDHVVLTRLSPEIAAEQIAANKKWLEDVLGREVGGFAYVRGQHNRTIRQLVRQSGFRYARTVASLSDTEGTDPYRVPTTLQFFPHADATYLRNYLSGGPSLRRFILLRAVIGGGTLSDRLCRAAEACLVRRGCFHLWGHSWELDEHHLWEELDGFLAHLRRLSAHFVTNEECRGEERGARANAAGCIAGAFVR